ncbi:hypothetical protein FGO68_gene14314 [Halteria grandinella]|uniref:Uncharacterized protein n=1 Tax=Halteria grandinella TaxID=5974 RepID=A0A8J8NXB5_HALGN|nr:hypothetical protein FGO68_gene14314 [Halteria grandinella]
MMSSPADDSIEAFLINDCHLQGDCLATTFLKQLGFKNRHQLQAILTLLSVKESTKLGLPELEATAIMSHCNKTSPKRTTSRMLPRLANKYLTLEIIWYAFVQPEAIDLVYLCHSYRQLLIKNYKLFKKEVVMAEKKVIESVFELLDERWLSKRYRLSYKGKDYEIDVADCLDVLGDRLHFHSISISEALLPVFSKCKPTQMEINDCVNIPQLFIDLLPSVNHLTLKGGRDQYIESESGNNVRKFRKLKLFSCKYTLDMLSIYATVTESLTIDGDCLQQPGVIEYLTQMDCKQIIVKTHKLECEYLIEFFSCQSKAIKFIECWGINYSEIEQVEWASKYLTQKCINKQINISIDQNIDDAKVLYETLFSGPLNIFKNKRIQGRVNINGNVCLPNVDTHTQSLSTDSVNLAVLALNNCKGLTKLKIKWYSNKYQELVVEKLYLQELIISCYKDRPLLQDIFKKSKDTLRSLKCWGTVNLSPLRESTQLRILRIKGDINHENFEVIRTFSNLKELETSDQELIGLFKESKALKTVNYKGQINEKLFDNFPQSLTTLSVNQYVLYDQVKEFIEENPLVKELTKILLYTNEAAALLNQFKHVKFNFTFDNPSMFTFSQYYCYLHPQCKQIGMPASEPDHVLYELLFKRIEDKDMLLGPYLWAARNEGHRLIYCITSVPTELMECLSTFNEFKNCLRIDSLDSDYFESVFNWQMYPHDDEYLRIIVTAYDEAFQLQADIDNTVTMLKGMEWEMRSLKREGFFHHCRHNWIDPLTNEDFLSNDDRWI